MPNYHNNMYCHQRPAPQPAARPAVCRTSAGCRIPEREIFSEPVPPAMAYVQWQKWEDLYDLCQALECGTIFSSLDKPFLMKGGRMK